MKYLKLRCVIVVEVSLVAAKFSTIGFCLRQITRSKRRFKSQSIVLVGGLFQFRPRMAEEVDRNTDDTCDTNFRTLANCFNFLKSTRKWFMLKDKRSFFCCIVYEAEALRLQIRTFAQACIQKRKSWFFILGLCRTVEVNAFNDNVISDHEMRL